MFRACRHCQRSATYDSSSMLREAIGVGWSANRQKTNIYSNFWVLTKDVDMFAYVVCLLRVRASIISAHISTVVLLAWTDRAP